MPRPMLNELLTDYIRTRERLLKECEAHSDNYHLAVEDLDGLFESIKHALKLAARLAGRTDIDDLLGADKASWRNDRCWRKVVLPGTEKAKHILISQNQNDWTRVLRHIEHLPLCEFLRVAPKYWNSVSPNDFIEILVGARFVKVHEAARMDTPAIIDIDALDAAKMFVRETLRCKFKVTHVTPDWGPKRFKLKLKEMKRATDELTIPRGYIVIGSTVANAMTGRVAELICNGKRPRAQFVWERSVVLNEDSAFLSHAERNEVGGIYVDGPAPKLYRRIRDAPPPDGRERKEREDTYDCGLVINGYIDEARKRPIAICAGHGHIATHFCVHALGRLCHETDEGCNVVAVYNAKPNPDCFKQDWAIHPV